MPHKPFSKECSRRAISYHFPRYRWASKLLTGVTPLGIPVHPTNIVEPAINNISNNFSIQTPFNIHVKRQLGHCSDRSPPHLRLLPLRPLCHETSPLRDQISEGFSAFFRCRSAE